MLLNAQHPVGGRLAETIKMKDFIIIVRLLAVIVFLILGLFAFMAFRNNEIKKQAILGCGTVDLQVGGYCYPNYLHRPLEHAGLNVFEENCNVCHTMDDVLVGPPLRNTVETRDSIWIRYMIKDATKLIDNGDTLANKLFTEYHEIKHPGFEAMDEQSLNDLIEYLRLEGLRDDKE